MSGGQGWVLDLTDPLVRAADAALSQPSLFPADDQYLYVRTVGQTYTSMSIGGRYADGEQQINAIATAVDERWLSAGLGSVAAQPHRGDAFPLGARCRALAGQRRSAGGRRLVAQPSVQGDLLDLSRSGN